jgi:transposase
MISPVGQAMAEVKADGHVARGAHAVLLLDRAGWHTTAMLDMPKNITPIFLPSRAPELNPVENVWQYLRANWLSSRLRKRRFFNQRRIERERRGALVVSDSR